MEIKYIFTILILGFLGILINILGYKFIERKAKKANYNCLKCSIYDCPSKICITKKGI